MGYTHGRMWTDENIKSEVLGVKDGLKLNRMPTKNECDKYTKSYALSVAISRRDGGWYKLADDLKLPIKNSETTLGKIYERKIADVLSEKGFNTQRMSQNFPYDLLIDDCVKIDVKASHLYKGKVGNFYSFCMGKPYATCDIYILVSLADNNEITEIYVIPSSAVINNKQISIGEYNSIYHKYKNAFDLIRHYSDFYKGAKNK